MPEPVEQKDRTIIVDIVRGFALIGVLIANFTSYVDQQTPQSVLLSISSPIDKALTTLNSVFFEWKFMTLFSILFGYGFGLILESLERKNINPNSFFVRRMFWLFVFGCIHSLFWWADVLHLYAISGILLLLFRRKSDRALLIYAALFALILPPLVSWSVRNQPETFTETDIQQLYDQYKTGNLFGVFKFNINFYYRMFIISGSDLHDIIETLGRFLLGYFLLRLKLFHALDTKRHLFRRIALLTAPVMVVYSIITWLSISHAIQINQSLRTLLAPVGIFCTTTFYVSILVLFYISFGMNIFFTALQALGRMTLTNYLMVSAFLIVLLYGFGLNRLGVLPMHNIWLFALGWLFVEVGFSLYWLSKFRYGPLEWIWRQLSYRKRLALRK